jgi:hypothetical protein
MAYKKMWKIYEVIETRGNIVLNPKPEFQYNSPSSRPLSSYEEAKKDIESVSSWGEDWGRVLTILPLYVLEDEV